MSNNIYNIGTAVYYGGDDTNDGGFGKITAQNDNYLGELELEITLDDGRRIFDVTPADFEARKVLGNTAIPEFCLADGEVISDLEEYRTEEEDVDIHFLGY
jgi:hypothetical protein